VHEPTQNDSRPAKAFHGIFVTVNRKGVATAGCLTMQGSQSLVTNFLYYNYLFWFFIIFIY